MLKVSVVVPVYNAGEDLDRCGPSLLEQTLSAADYEVIYVDDGSTDDSRLRLERLTARFPHARFVSQPNSGWPGKPRNVGISLSTAAYVQFVDQDDQLAPYALERLHAAAVANRADIAVGKLGGTMAGPNPLYRRTVAAARVPEVAATETLTGHKMFRRQFLLDHQIAFPEGYWRMEDLLFVTRAYAQDPRLTVLADDTYYFWNARVGGGNSSTLPFDIPDHYRRLRVIVDTARESPAPADLRLALLRRLFRIETLSRIGERYIADPKNTDWREAFPHLRAVAREAFPPEVLAGMPAIQRLRGTLVVAGEQEACYALAPRLAALVPVIKRRRVVVDQDAVLRADLTFSLAFADRTPLTLVRDGERDLLDPALTAGLPEVERFDAGDPLLDAQAQLQLHDGERHVWWYPEAELTPTVRERPDGRRQVVLTGRLSVDPATAADGRPLPPGRYTVWFTGQLLGLGRRRRLVMPAPAREAAPEWSVSAAAPVVMLADWTGPGARLELVVRDRQEWLAEQLDVGDLVLSEVPSLPVRVGGRLPPEPVPVLVAVGDQPYRASLAAEPGRPGEGRLTLPPPTGLPDGRHAVIVAGAFSVLAEVDVGRGQIRWVEGLVAGTLAGLGPPTDPPAEPPTDPRAAPAPTPRLTLGERLRRRWRRP